MTRLSAVPVPQPAEIGHVPDGWPQLRAQFKLAMRGNLADATIATYLEGTDAFARFLAERSPGCPVEAATRDDLRAFLADLADRGLKPNTCATRHRALRALFKFMVGDEIIDVNPMRAIPSPRITEERVPPALTPDQIDAMVAACGPKGTFAGSRDRALILLISSSGIRAAECIGLREADLHLDSETPHVEVKGKGDRYRKAACSYDAARAVLAYLRQRRKRPTAYRPELWLSRTGKGMTTSGLLQVVRDAGKRVGIDVHTHALRHTATHQMLERGMSDHDTATQLGHKGLKQLARYGRARATERSQAAFFRTLDR
jgi:integrase/recombinase XerC